MTEIISCGMTWGEVLSLWNSPSLLTAKRGKFPNSIIVFANIFTLHSLDDMGEIFTAGAWATQKCLQGHKSELLEIQTLLGPFSACLGKDTQQTWWELNGQHREHPQLEGTYWDPHIPAPGPAQGSHQVSDSFVQKLPEFWQERHTEEIIIRKLSQKGHYNLLLD